MTEPLHRYTDSATGFIVEQHTSAFGGTYWLALESNSWLAPMAADDTPRAAIKRLTERLERAYLRPVAPAMRRAA